MIRVLLVENDPCSAELLVLFLEKTGSIQVDTALSSFEARERIQAARYDAAVLDTTVMAGDLMPFIRDARLFYPSIALILQSNRGDEQAALPALSLGADFYLSKEWDPHIRYTKLHHLIWQAVRQHAAEEALRQSEERHRSFFENFKGIAYEMKTDGTPVFFEGAVLKITGYSQEDFLQGVIRLEEIVFPGDRALLNASDEKIRGFPFYSTEREYRIVRRDGNLAWVHDQIQNITDHTGTPVSIQGVVFDITKRKIAEETIRENQERLMRLANDVHDMIFRYELTPSRRFTYISPAAAAITGYTPEEFYADPDLGKNTVHPDDQMRFRSVLQGNIPKKRPVQLQRIKKNGRIIWTEELDVPVFNTEGDLIAIEGVVRDITARKRSEDLHRENEERLKLAIEGAGIGIWDRDMETGDETFNRQWAEQLGYSEEEFSGEKNFYEQLIHPDDRERIRQTTEDYLLGKIPFFTVEYRVRCKDGRWKWVQSVGRAQYRAGHKRPYRMTGILMDITGMYMARAGLEEANKKLNLLANITRHDILNKLTGMFGYLYLLDEILPDDERMRKYFERIRSLADTIQRQISFTRDYQDMGVRSPLWQNVAAIVRLSALSVPMLGITLEITTGALEIYADPLLEKVFFNLLDNAVRHGEHVTGIYVSWERRDDSAVIIVEDNGVGVPEPEKKDIFKRGVGRNTGFGLFLVREILGITGMTIRETGTEGNGARFEIEVPPDGFRLEPASTEGGQSPSGEFSQSATP